MPLTTSAGFVCPTNSPVGETTVPFGKTVLPFGSTVVAVDGAGMRVLRPGAVSERQLAAALKGDVFK